MPIISFASSKGGSGKTTACLVLASEISNSTSVTVIDADPAQRVMRWRDKGALPDTITVRSCYDERRIMDEISRAAVESTVVLIDTEGVSSRLNTFISLKSDLVIVPTGDEQQDAEDAISTLAQVRLDGESAGRPVSARVLFTRVKAAVKSDLERSLNADMRANLECFDTELVARTAYSSLHNLGGTLSMMNGVGGLDKALANAQALAGEVLAILMEDEHVEPA